MRVTRIAMSGLFCLAILPLFLPAIVPIFLLATVPTFPLAIVPIAGVALTFGDSGWTMLIGVGVMFVGTGMVIALHMARSKREFRSAEPEPPSEKISGSLVALSSAAILAVYSAGFFHTRTAASRFLEEAAIEQQAVATIPVPVPADSANAEPAGTAPSLSTSSTRAKAAARNGAKPDRAATPGASPARGADTPAPGESGSDAGANENSPSPAANGEPGSDSAGASNQGEQTADSGTAGAPAAPAAKVRYKDGTYQGWGTCRHGDIQATVVIGGGKIASADISKCYTRYPCDIISQLPGQVVTRQSVAVDYVSGATQSVYAFQQAVAAALAMAKGK